MTLGWLWNVFEMTLELFCIQIEPDKFYKTSSLTKHKEEVEECNVALSLLCCQQPTIFCSSAKICLPEVHYFEVSSFHFLSCTTLFINTFSEWIHTERYYLCNISFSNWTNRNMYWCFDFRMLKLFQNKKGQTFVETTIFESYLIL